MNTTINDGVWPVMITPFTQENKIDYHAVERLLNWYADSKVAGVFALCSSSEMFTLSFQEKQDLLRFICKNSPKELQIIASGHTADSLEEQIEEAKYLCDNDISAYVLLSNRFEQEGHLNDEIFKEKTEIFMQRIPYIPLGLYECPIPYKRLLTPELLKWCADTGRFMFLKDTCCDTKQIAEKMKAIKGTGLKLFNANSATLLDTLRLGASGFSGVMANIHPQLYSWLCENYDKQPQRAERLMNFLGVSSIMETQLYPNCAKWYLNQIGVTMESESRVHEGQQLTFAQKTILEQLRCINEELSHEFSK